MILNMECNKKFWMFLNNFFVKIFNKFYGSSYAHDPHKIQLKRHKYFWSPIGVKKINIASIIEKFSKTCLKRP